MAQILHSFSIDAPIDKVFERISTSKGLELWWTKSSSGKSVLGEVFQLFFEPDYHWVARVSKYIPHEEFELTMQQSDEDWEYTQVGFQLIPSASKTDVNFYHKGWKEENQHFRQTNFCWAMYLRILKKNLEWDEFVPYSERLNA